jgi:hypothetical protein
MLFRENASQSSEKNEEAMKFFYSDSSLFIGAEGGQFRELASIRPLRDFWMTRVTSDVPTVTFFY